MAEEFGIQSKKLAYLMRDHNGPKPKLDLTRSATGKAQVCWYDPDEVRAWYKSLSCVDDV